MTTEQITESPKRKRGRSPSYPGIDLKEAVDKARILYNKEGRNAAPVETILAHWGYKRDSGPGYTALAAVKKFGLLNDEGSGPRRKARLSDKALRILLDQRDDSRERLQALQSAALAPPIHADLWRKYEAALPSEATLKYELQMDRNFTERGADEFIPQYKRTIEFAQLTDHDKLSGEIEDKPLQESEGFMAPPTKLEAPPEAPAIEKHQPRVIQLPISATEWAALQAPFPITEAKWKQMLAVLEAMKPALVKDSHEDKD